VRLGPFRIQQVQRPGREGKQLMHEPADHGAGLVNGETGLERAAHFAEHGHLPAPLVDLFVPFFSRRGCLNQRLFGLPVTVGLFDDKGE
jgi:hypothetical protein